MKQKKQFTELSDEELKNVTGGFKLPFAPGDGESPLVCGIYTCPEYYKLDIDSCQCVPA